MKINNITKMMGHYKISFFGENFTVQGLDGTRIIWYKLFSWKSYQEGIASNAPALGRECAVYLKSKSCSFTKCFEHIACGNHNSIKVVACLLIL